MPRCTVPVSLLCLTLACGSNDGDKAPAPAFEQLGQAKAEPPPKVEADPRAAVYERAMDAMADEVVGKTVEGAQTEFETYAQAKAALDAALPVTTVPRLDEAIINASITEADMAAFMRDNPELVQKIGARFNERVAKVRPQLAQLVGKAAALATPQQRAALQQELEELGHGGLLSAPAWTSVATVDELEALARQAAAADKALLVDVSAAWCVPCRELEDKTLSNADVGVVLAESFVLGKFDVTEPDADAQRLQTSLGASSLPALLAWKDPSVLAETLQERVAASRSVAAPDFAVRVFVEPSELLPKLQGIAGT